MTFDLFDEINKATAAYGAPIMMNEAEYLRLYAEQFRGLEQDAEQNRLIAVVEKHLAAKRARLGAYLLEKP